MSSVLIPTELRNLQIEDLKKEILEKKLLVAKLRVENDMHVLKDTAMFLREKKNLARLLSVLREVNKKETENVTKPLKAKKKTPTLHASTK